MAVLRERMDDEFDDVIENAQVLGDWKFYVRKYPWICLAGAAAAGFVVVPGRSKTPYGIQTMRTPGTVDRGAVDKRVATKPGEETQPPSPGGAFKSMVVNMLMRTAVTYAGRRLGAFLTDGLEAGGRDAGGRDAGGRDAGRPPSESKQLPFG